MKKSIFCLLLFISFQKISAQTFGCGTPNSPDILKGINIDSLKKTDNFATAKTYRVFFHILRNNDGSNIACTEAYIYQQLELVRQEFTPMDICFTIVGLNYIDNTTLNTNMNTDVTANLTALFSNDIANALNIYCHQELLTNAGTGLVGNAYAIPSNHLSIDIPENFNGVISHEIGHSLGLYHTFETYYGAELVNGTNCSTAGDKVCDTPADPNGGFNSTTCVYTGTGTDANGQMYNPLVNNLMSYYFNCMTVFTGGQNSRMNAVFSTNSTVNGMAINSNNLSLTNTTISSGRVFQSARYTIDAGNIANAGNYTINNSALVSFNANKITLKPGFRVSPTNGQFRAAHIGCQ